MRLAFVLTVLALLALPVDPAIAQIRLGLGGPITGPNATSGEEKKNGAEQAVEDINAAGGVLGQKIQTTGWIRPSGLAGTAAKLCVNNADWLRHVHQP